MDQDLKDTIKKLEEAKNRQEKIERIIILLSGLLIVVIFAIIGINIYSSNEETVSEPEVSIITEEKLPSKSSVIVEKTTQNEEKKEIVKNLEAEKETYTQPAPVMTKTAPEKTVETEKKEQPKEIPKKEKKPEPKTVSFKSGYYIQIGAFSTKKKAEKLLNKVKLKNVYIRKEGNLYKVLIGSFKNKKDAYQFMKKNSINGFVRKI